eukprot:6518130-Alexandrium_andersonii.AAC.1
MSASLVGSEMCIRDSASAMMLLHVSMTRSVMTSSDQPPTQTPGSHCVPVSYTHLTLPTICSV